MEWISVKDRFPTIAQDILVSDGKDIFIGARKEDKEGKLDFHVCQCDTSYGGEVHVTHWIELPNCPE